MPEVLVAHRLLALRQEQQRVHAHAAVAVEDAVRGDVAIEVEPVEAVGVVAAVELRVPARLLLLGDSHEHHHHHHHAHGERTHREQRELRARAQREDHLTRAWDVVRPPDQGAPRGEGLPRGARGCGAVEGGVA